MRYISLLLRTLITIVFIAGVFVYIKNTALTTPVQTSSTYSPYDLNRDGKKDLNDAETFRTHMQTQNLSSDFNSDGTVTSDDLSILLSSIDE